MYGGYCRKRKDAEIHDKFLICEIRYMTMLLPEQRIL